MAQTFDSLTPGQISFIEEQPIFFVATAPLSPTGHINLSPKGLDTFRVLSPGEVAYLDLTGSGNETAAHVTENARITIMFCSFSKQPLILRIYGTAEVVRRDDERWPELTKGLPEYVGARQVILVDIEFVQTSCGFGVPLMELSQDREALLRWAEAKGPEALKEYRLTKNSTSLDGLPAPMVVDRIP